jgi:hypothetical protein
MPLCVITVCAAFAALVFIGQTMLLAIVPAVIPAVYTLNFGRTAFFAINIGRVTFIGAVVTKVNAVATSDLATLAAMGIDSVPVANGVILK